VILFNATLLPLSPFIKRGIEGDYKKEEMVVDENFFHYLYEDQ
jgi:hypothetical protein